MICQSMYHIESLEHLPYLNLLPGQPLDPATNFSRCGLLHDAFRLALTVIKSLYNILEVTFDSLTLCQNITPLLKSLLTDEAYFSPYLILLQHALLSRLLSQLSQVYSTIQISNLLLLVVPLKEAGPAFIDDPFVLADEPLTYSP